MDIRLEASQFLLNLKQQSINDDHSSVIGILLPISQVGTSVTCGHAILNCFSHQLEYMRGMNPRIKKLIGSVVIVLIAFLYAIIATTIASAKLADASGLVHLIYFLISGMFWVVPAMFIINWMMKPAKVKDET